MSDGSQHIEGYYYDKFGIRKINPTKEFGREWFANWNNGMARSVIDGDKYDELFDPSGRRISMQVDGTGNLIIIGDAPRFLIRNNDDLWYNTESTLYFTVMGRTAMDLNGGAIENRNGDRMPPVPNSFGCDRGYMIGGGIRHSKSRTFIQKEVIDRCAYTISIGQDYALTSTEDLPLGKEVGIKVITKQLSSSSVSHQIYLDKEANNGWEKIAEKIDSGNWLAKRKIGCTACQNRPLNWIPGPTNAVRFRTDRASPAVFRKASVREIDGYRVHDMHNTEIPI